MISYNMIPNIPEVDFQNDFTDEEKAYYIIKHTFSNIKSAPITKSNEGQLRIIEIFTGMCFIHWTEHPEKADHFEMLLIYDDDRIRKSQYIYCEERDYFRYRKAANIVSNYFRRMAIASVNRVMEV